VALVRSTGLVLVLFTVVLLVGCGAESPREAGARLAVEDSLSAEYDRDRTKCTDNPAPWFIEKEATVFICAARRNDGHCDWYRATLKNAGWEVVVERPNGGCVLSF
jgi:hypothetical protein